MRLHVTEKRYAGSWRSEGSWPLSRTVRKKYFLCPNGSLALRPDSSTDTEQSVEYDAQKGSASWSIKFSEPTEVTGSAKLRLRFAVEEGASDADIFVALQKLDRDGKLVTFPYHTFINDGHVAYGWLRASNRELDPSPHGDEVAHTFRKEHSRPLTPHEPMDLDINIQPSATLFRKGETLVVVVQGHDFGEYSEASQIPRAGTGINKNGRHDIFLGDSFLEVPIIPR